MRVSSVRRLEQPTNSVLFPCGGFGGTYGNHVSLAVFHAVREAASDPVTRDQSPQFDCVGKDLIRIMPVGWTGDSI